MNGNIFGMIKGFVLHFYIKSQVQFNVQRSAESRGFSPGTLVSS